jgi:hypothetical protein
MSIDVVLATCRHLNVCVRRFHFHWGKMVRGCYGGGDSVRWGLVYGIVENQDDGKEDDVKIEVDAEEIRVSDSKGNQLQAFELVRRSATPPCIAVPRFINSCRL